MKTQTDFDTLARLAQPLHDWLMSNYSPHACIIIECGYVKVIEEDCGQPLEVAD